MALTDLVRKLRRKISTAVRRTEAHTDRRDADGVLEGVVLLALLNVDRST